MEGLTAELKSLNVVKKTKSISQLKKLKTQTSGKKKRRKLAKLEQLVPLNLSQEKERFFASDFKRNPQFIYSFERLRFPVEI